MGEHSEAGGVRIEEEIKNTLNRICTLASHRSESGRCDTQPLYGVLFRVASVGLALAEGGIEHPIIRTRVLSELRSALKDLGCEPPATAAPESGNKR